jgi:superfamily II DNA/RNA helicase
MGFSDGDFILPELKENETILKCSRPLPGKLFVEPAMGLKEQRDERRYTIVERCEEVSQRVNGNSSAVIWCQLNAEGDLLEKIIPDAKQIKGGMSDEKKEQRLMDFSKGDLRILVTKPKIGAFGLNWQHCNHMTFFPSHSYEQYYQGVRRCWRFGQKKPVLVDIITTEGELSVLANLQRKARASDKMFDNLIKFMNESKQIKIEDNYQRKAEVPKWL